MIAQEIYTLKSILESFLGNSKRDLTESYQLQFPCPRCIEHKGESEAAKYNLEVNLKRGVFNCWSCGQYDDEMHGSLKKLILLYGGASKLNDYNAAIKSLKESKLYQISFGESDFNIDKVVNENTELLLPKNYRVLSESDKRCAMPLSYLKKRGITWDIIHKFHIGYTIYDSQNKQLSNRIVIPSFNQFDELTYWTSRDYLPNSHRQKYFNPIVERKDLVFNEKFVDWDADITLVEGPFDHIVVPNSIPLLGKALTPEFKLFQLLIAKSNANVNIFLDADAFNNVKQLYKLLNHDRLYGKIRYIPVPDELDPSSIFEKFGKRGIISCLRNSCKLNECYLY